MKKKVTTEESIQKINDGLNEIYPIDQELFMFHDHFNDMMERSITDPDFT
jgi:hypothetical protein